MKTKDLVRSLVLMMVVMGGPGVVLGNLVSQNFDALPVGSDGGWSGGSRWYNEVTGRAAVTDTASRSAPNSLRLKGDDSVGQSMFWGGWQGQKSTGTAPITVSFDMNIHYYEGNVAVNPFSYNNTLYGGNGNGTFGWPVVINFTNNNTIQYSEETGPITMLTVSRADILDQWVHIVSTINPTTRTADASVEILTGPQAGASGSVTGKQFQYGVAGDHYGSAMDDLAATVFLVNDFYNAHNILIDNYNVSGGIVPEPATLGLLVLGGLLVRRKKIGF